MTTSLRARTLRSAPRRRATSPDRGAGGTDWRFSGACRTEDPDLFFPAGNSGPYLLQIEEAKAVCRRCPVMEQCLRWALDTGQDAGVWGGLSEDERRSMRRRAARRSHTPSDAAQELQNEYGDTIRRMVVEQRRISVEIAAALGVQQPLVESVIRRMNLGVPAAVNSTVAKLLEQEHRLRMLKERQGLSIDAIARHMGAPRNAVSDTLRLIKERDAAAPALLEAAGL